METNDYMLRADLAEASSEIRRHHDFIQWMRTEIEWLIEAAYWPVLGKEDTQRIEAIQRRLNREVG